MMGPSDAQLFQYMAEEDAQPFVTLKDRQESSGEQMAEEDAQPFVTLKDRQESSGEQGERVPEE